MKNIDRLREYTNGDALRAGMSLRTARDGILAHIDAIEREVKELTDERDLLKTQWEAGVDFDQRLEAAADKREDVTLFGVDYTALPEDADGVPIHVGDKLTDGEYTFVVDELAAFGDGSWSIRNEDGNAWAACDVTHHHAPTVEDVLEEFVARWMETHHDDIPALKAEYAARLRLAGDE